MTIKVMLDSGMVIEYDNHNKCLDKGELYRILTVDKCGRGQAKTKKEIKDELLPLVKAFLK